MLRRGPTCSRGKPGKTRTQVLNRDRIDIYDMDRRLSRPRPMSTYHLGVVPRQQIDRPTLTTGKEVVRDNLEESPLEGSGRREMFEKSFQGLLPEEEGLTTVKRAMYCNVV